MCSLTIETKTDPHVTKMTQKLEFIATRTIEKPPVKSSTYYATVGSTQPDVRGTTDQPSGPANTDSMEPLAGRWSSPADTRVRTSLEKNEEEDADNAVPAETVAMVTAPQPKKEKLSEKFRQWQHEQAHSDFEWSQRSPKSVSDSSPRQTVDDMADVDRGDVCRPQADRLLSEVDGKPMSSAAVSEGEPSTSMSREHECLDITDDILQRNLTEDGVADIFDDAVGTGSKAGDVRDDVDLSQMVERNWPADELAEKRRDSRPVEEGVLAVDQLERRVSLSASRGTIRGVFLPRNELVSADDGEPETRKSCDTSDTTVDQVERISSTSSSEATVLEVSPLPKELASSDEKAADIEGLPAEKSAEMTGDGPDPADSQLSPRDASDPQERAIRPDRLEYEGERATGGDGVEQEVETTVNSRDLETTDEIVVATKVTETKTTLMHLGETGSISVLETTEVKTDTDMKETKKVLEHDEVAVSHRSTRPDFSSFIPLSPTPSPAGSLRSVTADSVEKLAEPAGAGVGVDAGLYVAVCPYEPETDDVMSLHEGEYLELLEDAAEDWWLVKKSFDGREGYVPAQYLRDKQTDDRMIEEEVAKQMETIDLVTCKTVFYTLI